jgi:hypothetical protein
MFDSGADLMRTTATVFTVLFAAVSFGHAAPAPDVDRQAKDKLAELARKLPAALEDAWAKNPCRMNDRSVVFRKDLRLHRVRLTGPAEAKVSVRFMSVTKDGEHFIPIDLSLRYYDGRWTTLPPLPDTSWDMDYAQRWLAQVIDDAAE